MNRFIKNENGSVIEKIIILCIAGLLIIHLFRLIGYIECINNKSMDRVSSAISGLIYKEEMSVCKKNATSDNIDDAIGDGSIENENGSTEGGGGTIPGGVTDPGGGNQGGGSSGGGSDGGSDGSSGDNGGVGSNDDYEYYNFAEVNPTCTASTFNYPFLIPIDATVNSMGTKTITVTNQSGYDIWVQISKITPKNNLTITTYDLGYKTFKNGESATFDVSWNWTTGNRGSATVLLSTICSQPADSDMYVPLPLAPKNVKVLGTNESLIVTWDAGKYASSYKLVLNAPNGYGEKAKTMSTTGTGYTFTNLHPGTEYSFTIQSVNRMGSSEAVSSRGKTTGVSRLPGPPSALKLVSRTDNTISISWTAGTNVTNYSSVASANGVTGGKPTGTSYTFTNLEPGTTYRISVVSQNSWGNSTEISMSVSTTGSQLIPANPSNIKITNITNTTMTITWSPTARANYYVINSYGHGRIIYTGTNTSFTVSGLKANTSYLFTVTAINNHGRSANMTAYDKTTNIQYNDTDTPSPTACQAGSYMKEYAMPENIKPGTSGKFEIKIANTLKGNISAIVSVSDKVGGYFGGSTPVTLMFDSSPLVVAPDGTGSRMITWSLSSSAGTEYNGQMGSFSALVLLECS